MNGSTLHPPMWRRLLVPFLVLLSLNAAVFLAYTLPRSVQERTLTSSAETLRVQVARERKAAEELRRQSETMVSNKRDAKRFYEDLVGGRDPTQTLEELSRIAAGLGLQLGRRAYDQEEVKGAPLVRFEINMPISGTYRELISFLDRLERSPRFLTVDSIKLKEKKEESRADLDIVISSYFRSGPEAGDRGPAPGSAGGAGGE